MDFDVVNPTRRTLLGGLAVSLLSLPSRAAPSPQAAGEVVTLTAKPGTVTLRPGMSTAIWGYDGKAPGPLLRIRKGQPVKVRLVNGLADPTCLSWHGVRNLNAMDGVAGLTQPPVAPGAHFDYVFTPPDAGLYWYHPAIMPSGATQTGRGLYGALIVDEPNPPPSDQDLLLIVADWTLDAKGQVASNEGAAGSLVMVNGRTAPEAVTARPGARLRLRLLNACTARIAMIGFESLQATVIAIDGQPSEIFKPARDMVPVGPGARFELMLDLPKTAGSTKIVLRGEGEADRTLLNVTVAGAPLADHPPVVKLPDNPLLPSRIRLEASTRRDVVLAGAQSVTLNGATADRMPGKPLFSVKRGGAVTLTFKNTTAKAQQVHVHGHVWRLLHDLDDGWDPYWRDSVLLAPGKTKHVAFVADNPGKWALVSSIADGRGGQPANWFEVT